MKVAAKFRYFAFVLLLIIEFDLYDALYVRSSVQPNPGLTSEPLYPVVAMLALLGATLFMERYFNLEKNLPFNAIAKVLALVIIVLYIFYLLPIPVRRSSQATLFLFAIGGFVLASLIRDVCLFIKRKKSP